MLLSILDFFKNFFSFTNYRGAALLETDSDSLSYLKSYFVKNTITLHCSVQIFLLFYGPNLGQTHLLKVIQFWDPLIIITTPICSPPKSSISPMKNSF